MRTLFSRIWDPDVEKDWVDAPELARRRQELLPYLTLANLALLFLIYLAQLLIAERHWLATVATYVPQQPFLVPTAALLIWALLKKDWHTVVLNLVVVGFFAFLLLGINVPLFCRPGAGSALRVMTYNADGGQLGTRKLADAIAEQAPDVVCLQEMDPAGQFGDPLGRVLKRLPGWRAARFGDVATLSRYPIVGYSVHRLPGDKGRIVLETTLKMNNHTFSVLNTHFIIVPAGQMLDLAEKAPKAADGTAALQTEQSSALLDMARRLRGPFVICGDFNMPPRGLNYNRIADTYQDSFRAAGWGCGDTFRTDIPVMRIDYIFLSKDVNANRCWVPNAAASDHRPVVADLIVKR